MPTPERVRKLLRRALLGLAAVVLAVVALFAYVYFDNAQRTRAFLAAPDPRGRLVGSAGARNYVRVRGSGRPAVVIVAGLSPAFEWWKVQDALAQRTTVVSYDRAGYGYSDPAQNPRDAAHVAGELRGLLRDLQLPPPYVLVGESIGALYVQEFARSHPAEVAAAALVHPITTGHGRFEQEFSRAAYQNLINLTPRIQAAGVLARLGLLRWSAALPYAGLVPEPARLIHEFYASESNYRTMLAEYRALDESIAQVQAAGPFPNVPLRVLHHCPECFVDELQGFQVPYDEAQTKEALWHELDLATAQLSPRGRVIAARKSTRYLHVLEPELVAQTVLELLDEVR
jgi:pimeloyl-ACP methyl ester carboxylesterase